MFDTADIQIYGCPFLQCIHACQLLIVMNVCVTQEIPAGACPLRHCVCFTLCRSAADRACCVYPFIDMRQRRFACFCGLIGFYIGQQYGQLILRNRNGAAVFAVDKRNGFAPVSLSGEYPVTQFVVGCLSAPTFFLHQVRNLLLCIECLHAVPVAGVYDDTVTCVSFRQRLSFILAFGQDNRDDGQFEFCRKIKVTFIMRRYTHYCTGTIISQYIVSNPDRDFLAVYGVHAVGARKYACFFFICHTVNGRFCRCFVAVFFYGILLLCGCQCSQTFIFGSQHHKGTAVQCIRSCGVNSDFIIRACQLEINLSTIGFANPVGLHFLYLIRPIQLIQILQQSVCVCCDFQHPLTQVFLCYNSTAAFMHTTGSLFVCQYAFTFGTPVQRHFLFISQTQLSVCVFDIRIC